MKMKKRTLLLIAGVLVVWGSLGFHFIVNSDPMDRMLAIVMGIGITALAVLISRGPLLPKERGGGFGGAESDLGNIDSHDSHDHTVDGGGHGGSEGDEGGDGGGHS